MFWSKIWFFLVALIAAAAVTVALVLPRPAQRQLVRGEANRLQTACGVVHILLADDARNRVELAGAFVRTPAILDALEAASTTSELDEPRMKQVRDVGDTVMKAIQGNRKPDFAMLIDRRGRVVARVRIDDGDFGDLAAGRPLIDDALAGYLRDDVWASNGTMFFVSAAPVVKQGSYVGAVVLGHKLTNELATSLVKSLAVDVGFHLGGESIASSKTIAFDHAEMQAAIGKLGNASDVAGDCQAVTPIEVRAGSETYTALVARLPGEATAKQAYYSVLVKRPESLGFLGTLKSVTDNDLSFGNFPWLIVGGGFLVALALGIGLMFLEADRPLRRLARDAVRLAKGDTERLSEDAHGGKLGSIARSVNIHIDKLGREAKSAKKDLDQLLGPAPEGSLGTIDLLATPLPSVRPGGPAPAVPPPPSEFRFQDTGAPQQQRKPPPVRNTPPPFRVMSPAAPPLPGAPPMPSMTPPPERPQRLSQPNFASLSFDDDILGPPPEPPAPRGSFASRAESSAPRPGPTSSSAGYYRQIFEQFVSVKKSCNESIQGLVYERFAEKLEKNRDDLMMKTGCREVRFTVYVKDGKAALKATPVKDEL